MTARGALLTVEECAAWFDLDGACHLAGLCERRDAEGLLTEAKAALLWARSFKATAGKRAEYGYRRCLWAWALCREAARAIERKCAVAREG
jgi:hypothetical protein